MFKSYRVDVDKIALRFTHALEEKKGAYERARAKGIIKGEDGYVIAINSAGIEGGSDRDFLPYWLRGFLPLGSPAITFNKTTAKLSERPHYQYQGTVLKSNETEIAADNFLRREYQFCSAVLHSGAGWFYPENSLGHDFAILHNPLAVHSLDQTVFSQCTQYTVEEIVGNSRINAESEIRIRTLGPES